MYTYIVHVHEIKKFHKCHGSYQCEHMRERERERERERGREREREREEGECVCEPLTCAIL